MDRFKFRVWDHIFKEFTFATPALMHTGILCGMTEQQQDRYEIQLCTGLQDKNGNLVFEGDIVKSYNDEICEIVYIVNDCCFEISSKWNDHPMCNLDFKFTISKIYRQMIRAKII